MKPRIVITGAGCITPIGTEVAEFARNLAEGRSGIGPITLFETDGFPIQIAAEIHGWDVSDVGEEPAGWAKYPRQTRFAVAAAKKAVCSAGLCDAKLPPHRMGVFFGCGETFLQLHELADLVTRASPDGKYEPAVLSAEALERPNEESPYSDPHLAATAAAGICGAQGPSANMIAGCVSSSLAICRAAETIRRGEAEVMLAGGSHSMIHPIGLSGFHLIEVLSTANERGAAAMRPFDRERDGFVAGEAAAVVVVEQLGHALARGAEIWGELTGYADTHDAFRVTDTHPDGRGLVTCMHKALEHARLKPDDIDYISAHGTSTPLNDRVETIALKRALGEAAYRIPVSSIKSMLGHSTTACGVVELVSLLMVLRTGVLPPTINYEVADPACDLDYVPNTAREKKCRHVMNANMGFGGQNAVLIVSRYDGKKP
jgi:3-oxoacyl-[acyl-carrier-protein] synthase II